VLQLLGLPVLLLLLLLWLLMLVMAMVCPGGTCLRACNLCA
jgi:hypothetical protein